MVEQQVVSTEADLIAARRSAGHSGARPVLHASRQDNPNLPSLKIYPPPYHTLHAERSSSKAGRHGRMLRPTRFVVLNKATSVPPHKGLFDPTMPASAP